jgi:uncharacterized protein
MKVFKQVIKDLRVKELNYALLIYTLICSLITPLISYAEVMPIEPTTSNKRLAKEGVPHPFFWDVHGSKGEVIHLMGTMHIPDPRWVNLPSSLLKDLDRADAVYGELNLTDKEAMSGQLMKLALLSNGDTLEKLIGPKIYKKLDQYLQTRGQSALFMNGFHPKMAEMTLGLLDAMPLLMSGQPVLDEWLLKRAKKAGKTIGGIETVDEQIAALFAGTLEEAKTSLAFTIDLLMKKEKAGIKPFDALFKAYFSGREEAILSVLEEELKDAPKAQLKAMELLLNARNKVMVKRVIEKIKDAPKKRQVFAFGVAHFVGEEGIIKLLKNKGYTVLRRYAPTQKKLAE